MIYLEAYIITWNRGRKLCMDGEKFRKTRIEMRTEHSLVGFPFSLCAPALKGMARHPFNLRALKSRSHELFAPNTLQMTPGK